MNMQGKTQKADTFVCLEIIKVSCAQCPVKTWQNNWWQPFPKNVPSVHNIFEHTGAPMTFYPLSVDSLHQTYGQGMVRVAFCCWRCSKSSWSLKLSHTHPHGELMHTGAAGFWVVNVAKEKQLHLKRSADMSWSSFKTYAATVTLVLS